MPNRKVNPSGLEVGRRIRTLREDLGLSTREFSSGIPGLRSSNLSEIERGKRRLTSPMIEGIARKYRISADYFFGGDTRIAPPAQIQPVTIPVLGIEGAMEYLFGEAGIIMGIPVPVSGGETAPAQTRDPRAFYVRATDAVVAEPISVGDLVLVEPDRGINHGDTVVILAPCGMALRRYHRAGEDVVLTPLGGAAEPAVLDAKAQRGFRVYRVGAIVKPL